MEVDYCDQENKENPMLISISAEQQINLEVLKSFMKLSEENLRDKGVFQELNWRKDTT